MEGLTRDSRERLAEVFREDNGVVTRVWDEIQATDPELSKLIQDEGLRLFPDSPEHRARATRFVIEVVQSLKVSDLDSVVVFQP